MSKYALEQIPPLTLLMVQLFVSVALLWFAVLVQGVRVRLNRDALRLGLIGILNPGLAYMFSLIGLSRTTASMSAVLWAAEPILIIGFAWLLLCERLTWPLLASVWSQGWMCGVAAPVRCSAISWLSSASAAVRSIPS